MGFNSGFKGLISSLKISPVCWWEVFKMNDASAKAILDLIPRLPLALFVISDNLSCYQNNCNIPHSPAVLIYHDLCWGCLP